MGFGARLRAERQRRSISIASIAESTKILGALLEGLEHDDVSRWPTGFYRRAFIRAYAQAIGLDPEPVVREFVARFPDPDEAPAQGLRPAVPFGKAPRAVLRLTLADNVSTFSAGRLIRELPSRVSAVAVDAFVLSVIGLSLFLVLGAFWMPLSVAALGYYFGSILILGNTPGVCLFASRSSGGHGPRLFDRARRALTSWSGQLPTLVDHDASNPTERTNP